MSQRREMTALEQVTAAYQSSVDFTRTRATHPTFEWQPLLDVVVESPAVDSFAFQQIATDEIVLRGIADKALNPEQAYRVLSDAFDQVKWKVLKRELGDFI